MDTIPVETQLSAGGVVYRRRGPRIEVALISAGPHRRWQLPKGMIERGEEPAATAVREVREETGILGEVLGLIETVDYWFVSYTATRTVRFHKYVHFYLLRFVSGSVDDHDHEVHEACWLSIQAAARLMAFAGERRVITRAREMIHAADRRGA